MIQKKKRRWMFPWWCLFIAYAISFLFVGMSAFLIIARSIEFGDSKTQKWLTSLVTGFFSSVLLSQPSKVALLTIVFAFFTRRSTKETDREAEGFLDEEVEIYVNGRNDDRANRLLNSSSTDEINRLDENQVEFQRSLRLRELRMWKTIKEILYDLFFLLVLFLVNYLATDEKNFHQVHHIRRSLFNFDRFQVSRTTSIVVFFSLKIFFVSDCYHR